MSQTAIHSVLLFDGNDVKPNSTVVFDSSTGTITSVLPSSSPPPSNATIIDGTGHTLIPGLIDSHVHMMAYNLDPSISNTSVLTLPLQCGVTTVFDLGAEPSLISSLKSSIAAETSSERAKGASGRLTLSDMKSALHPATVDGGWPAVLLPPEEPPSSSSDSHDGSGPQPFPKLNLNNASAYIASQRAQGADYIKIIQENCHSLSMPTDSIPSPSLELQTAIISAAHDAGFLTVGHALSVEATELLLKAGVGGLAHGFMDQGLPDSLRELYRETGGFLVPTLAMLTAVTGEEQARREKWAGRAGEISGVGEVLGGIFAKPFLSAAEHSTVEHTFRAVRELKELGVDIVAGTDAVLGMNGSCPGVSLLMELEMYVDRCGFTPVEALRSATANAAKRFRFGDRGVVEVGRRADLVLVKGDVTQGLERLWDGGEGGIVGVWREGIASKR